MDFAIESGVSQKAFKVVLYGVEGIGKTTFASQFPKAVFIDTEGSTASMNVSRYPKPTSWQMLKDEVNHFITTPYQTLVIDTADWAEMMCVTHVCESRGKKGIEDFGYGQGYTYVAEEWGKFLNMLSDIVEVHHKNVVLTAHAIIRKFERPEESSAYDRYELKLGKKTTNQTAPLTKEWGDMVLFANYKLVMTNVQTDKNGKSKGKAANGQRLMYTQHHPCWDAKNRYGLAPELPFEYQQIKHIIEGVKQPEIKSVEIDLNSSINVDDHMGVSMMEVKQTPSKVQLDPKIPKQLRDLMEADNVTEEQLHKVVVMKGYMPSNMPVRDYPIDFINGWCIPFWQNIRNEIELPF